MVRAPRARPGVIYRHEGSRRGAWLGPGGACSALRGAPRGAAAGRSGVRPPGPAPLQAAPTPSRQPARPGAAPRRPAPARRSPLPELELAPRVPGWGRGRSPGPTAQEPGFQRSPGPGPLAPFGARLCSPRPGSAQDTRSRRPCCFSAGWSRGRVNLIRARVKMKPNEFGKEAEPAAGGRGPRSHQGLGWAGLGAVSRDPVHPWPHSSASSLLPERGRCGPAAASSGTGADARRPRPAHACSSPRDRAGPCRRRAAPHRRAAAPQRGPRPAGLHTPRHRPGLSCLAWLGLFYHLRPPSETLARSPAGKHLLLLQGGL